MSIFRPEGPKQDKDITPHPWARRIKDYYASRIKYAHNSVHNPKYPFKEEKQPSTDRIKFTIIGDRVTKEFTYCTELIKLLHKYRWKNFDAPVIRGVTTVEWPATWNDLKTRYGGLAFCLQSSVAVLLNDKILGGEKELKELVETKYIYNLCLDYYNQGVAEFAKFVRSTGRPFAYMHISIDSEHIGTLIFMLYADLVPYTSENFLRLCKEKKGGYGGTPVHRIVKDGWIQCGGFGLKSTPLDCENFAVPHDKRGVLAMANDGKHVDCSTQFFVLLQPAPWMAQKYVAFGQLVEGEATLKKIESVETWYESPKSEIIIYQCGILNMECHDIMINRGANEYISGHIEDLNALGEIMWEVLLEKVFLEARLRELERMKQMEGEGAEGSIEGGDLGVHATQRFNRKKEEIQLQLEKSQADSRRMTGARSAAMSLAMSGARSAAMSGAMSGARSAAMSLAMSGAMSGAMSRAMSAYAADENNDFDVEEYEYEPEEDAYKHQSIDLSQYDAVKKPERLFYIPLTDVPYPGEVDSNFDLRRFLKGDYCLESDLQKDAPKKTMFHENLQFPSELFAMSESESISDESLDSDEEKEIRRYLKLHVDRVSFAGGVIRNIARGKYNLFDDYRKSEMITDEELRRFRLASIDYRPKDDRNDRLKKVSICTPNSIKESHEKIKRRQTGFVRPQDLEKIHIIQKSDGEITDDESAADLARKVRIAPSAIGTSSHVARRPTGFVRKQDIMDSDTEVQRQSVLARLYDEVNVDTDHGPTLKEYKPMAETHHKNTLLTYSPNLRIKSDESTREKYMRHSLIVEDESFEQLLNLQHGKKIARKISSDYVKTIDQIEHRLENSIRSVEFAKTRPAISVSDYQMKNKKYQQGLKLMSTSQVKTVMKPAKDFDKRESTAGLRLPGDTPLYSMIDMKP